LCTKSTDAIGIAGGTTDVAPGCGGGGKSMVVLKNDFCS
jgi:hypothetical protein